MLEVLPAIFCAYWTQGVAAPALGRAILDLVLDGGLAQGARNRLARDLVQAYRTILVAQLVRIVLAPLS